MRDVRSSLSAFLVTLSFASQSCGQTSLSKLFLHYSIQVLPLGIIDISCTSLTSVGKEKRSPIMSIILYHFGGCTPSSSHPAFFSRPRVGPRRSSGATLSIRSRHFVVPRHRTSIYFRVSARLASIISRFPYQQSSPLFPSAMRSNTRLNLKFQNSCSHDDWKVNWKFTYLVSIFMT